MKRMLLLSLLLSVPALAAPATPVVDVVVSAVPERAVLAAPTYAALAQASIVAAPELAPTLLERVAANPTAVAFITSALLSVLLFIAAQVWRDKAAARLATLAWAVDVAYWGTEEAARLTPGEDGLDKAAHALKLFKEALAARGIKPQAPDLLAATLAFSAKNATVKAAEQGGALAVQAALPPR